MATGADALLLACLIGLPAATAEACPASALVIRNANTLDGGGVDACRGDVHVTGGVGLVNLVAR